METKIEWTQNYKMDQMTWMAGMAVPLSIFDETEQPKLPFDAAEKGKFVRAKRIPFDFWFGSDGKAVARSADGTQLIDCVYRLDAGEKVVVSRTDQIASSSDPNSRIIATFMLLSNGLYSFDYQNETEKNDYIFRRHDE